MRDPLDLLLPHRRSAPDAAAAVRLVCLPFAGGSAAAFRGWEETLGPAVDLCAVELPGRGRRVDEIAIDSMPSLVDRLLAALAPLLDRPALLFGHSMGARIAFELARREPRFHAVVASASRAPSSPPRRPISDLPTPAFLAAIADLGGTPPALLRDRELQRLLLPALRADFLLSDSYRAPPDAAVAAALTVLLARDDPHVDPAEGRAWGAHAGGSFSVVEIDHGGHFFLTSRRDAVLREVRGAVERVGAGSRR